MYAQISLKWLHLTEERLDESTLTDSVLSDDTNTISLREYRFSDIKQWLSSSNKCILDLDQSLGSVLIIWEVKLDLYACLRTLDEFDLVELFFSTLGKSCTRSSSESIDESLLGIYEDLLFFVSFFLFFFCFPLFCY